MHNQNLGTKQTCSSCQARFYDLGKDPITCPKCGWTLSLTELTKKSRGTKKNRDLEITPAEMNNESLIEYELDEDEFGEDLLIEEKKDDEEEDDNA